ncbi:MAG: hypothetical protein JO014_24735 [Metakosakonia sp.]|nr:hypothetical protein [Phytobacter sp.]MBV8875929.1 hypothetical protein [Phytobacter sp.]
MSKLLSFFLLATVTISAYSYAGQGGVGGKGGAGSSSNQNGGDGLPGKNGQSGMNGCLGGTSPASDGKYYLPGTKEQCNPVHKKHYHLMN